MLDLLRWLLVAELIGLACLPLTTRVFNGLRDRGYVFAKILGLLLVTYGVWLIGSFTHVASSPLVPAGLVALLTAGCWTWRGRSVIEEIGEIKRLVAIEEVLFVVSLVIWTVLRAFVFHPGIAHSEQFMDMAFLNASYHASSYPPYDPWLSGHTINYYYIGYLMFATLTKLSGVAPAVGFNLSLSLIFALLIAQCYSLGYALIRRYLAAGLAPLFVGILGNLHALWQLPHLACASTTSQPPNIWGWMWESTRVIGGNFGLTSLGCRTFHPGITITEYPLFSLVLGDLHPHVMALPVGLLALAFVANVLFARGDDAFRSPKSLFIVVAAIAIGALYAMNSWDLPTYLLLMNLALFARAYVRRVASGWWRRPLVTSSSFSALALLVWAPFYLHFKPPAHGLGLVSTPSGTLEFLQVMGMPLALSVALVFTVRKARMQGKDGVLGKRSSRVTAVTRATLLSLAGLCLLLSGHVVLAIDLLVVLLAGRLLLRGLREKQMAPAESTALIFVIVGALLLAATEIVYLRDTFDATASYRMNTIFKFYYQSWLMLGIASAYGAYRWVSFVTWRGLLRRFAPRLALVSAAILAASTYSVLGLTQPVDAYNDSGLNGESWVRMVDPGDFSAITWLQHHAVPGSVILEASAVGYDHSARISTFTGLPTVLGWMNHEDQWRPKYAGLYTRRRAVAAMYSSPYVGLRSKLLAEYGVRYVVVGPLERKMYSSSGELSTFATFMRTVHDSVGTVIYERAPVLVARRANSDLIHTQSMPAQAQGSTITQVFTYETRGSRL